MPLRRSSHGRLGLCPAGGQDRPGAGTGLEHAAVHVAEKVGMRPVGSDEDDEVGEVLMYEMARS